MFVARKGEVIPHEVSHEGEEFVYIIKGQMKMQVGEVEYLLNPGDSLYFNCVQKHGILPVSDEVIYLDIFVWLFWFREIENHLFGIGYAMPMILLQIFL